MSAGKAVDDLTKANILISSPTTMQTTIAKIRSDSVAEQYGWITPPGSKSPPKGGHKSSASSTRSGQATKLDRSERARHATNQRHTRSKQRRHHTQEERSGSNSSESVEEDEGVDNKKEKYREKNRMAAARCRAKKKDNTDGPKRGIASTKPAITF
ncbi:hypothetical protein LTR56_026032 [Elasticomyces elasticus]|nr:hypothetical protein LTR56_026032 [Elasticomyces elasticus]KAK4906252.1 hypothetical protein LTR49_024564 [Elasticomyces elasticus]KAK5739730.1 hypothetical protein LTS12_025181 [Elasticomyces elasticus]